MEVNGSVLMKKNRPPVAPILFLLLFNQSLTCCPSLKALFLSGCSVISHTVGGISSAGAAILGVRGVLTSIAHESETKKVSRFFENVSNDLLGGMLGQKDEAASNLNWFLDGDPEVNINLALRLCFCSLASHAVGFLFSFFAGHTIGKAEGKKSIKSALRKKKNRGQKMKGVESIAT